MTDIGYGCLILSLVASLYAALSFVISARLGHPVWQRSARNAVLATTGLATLAMLALLYSLLTKDFSVRYVHDHVSSYQALAYTLSALWAGQEGSLLLWLWLLSLLAGMIALHPWRWDCQVWPYLLAVLAFLESFLILLLATQSNPFVLLPQRPAEGLGLNPLLENFWMIVHPPVVFAGYALYSVPFALVVAGLLSGRMDDAFWAELRRWSLYAWLLLGAGILLGAWWAYLELGWGGYWGWDPVENSSLVPWLTGTALLHAAIARRRRGLFGFWVLLLTALTFLLCLFAAFVTRSGIIQSVHAFGRSSLSYFFLAFMATLSILVGVLLYRRRSWYASGYEVRDMLSREASFVLTNMVLCGIALVVFLGTIYPAVYEAFRGVVIVLNAAFYSRMTAPLFVVLVALLGICPLLRWGSTPWPRVIRGLAVPVVVALAVAALLYLFDMRQPAALLAYALFALAFSTISMQFLRDGWTRRRKLGGPFTQGLARAFSSNRRHYGAHIVHLGLVLIAVGITGSSLYKTGYYANLGEGESTSLPGYLLTYHRAIREKTPAQSRQAALVELSSKSGKHIAYLTPEKNYHWNAEQWVTEVAIHTNLVRDVYLVLGELGEDGRASLQVFLNPLVAWIWIGGGLLLLGTGIALLSPEPKERGQPISANVEGAAYD